MKKDPPHSGLGNGVVGSSLALPDRFQKGIKPTTGTGQQAKGQPYRVLRSLFRGEGHAYPTKAQGRTQRHHGACDVHVSHLDGRAKDGLDADGQRAEQGR